MEEQEYQEQLQAAAQIIIEAAQGIKSFQEATEAYKTMMNKVIERVSRRPDAVIPDSEYQKIRDMVSAEIIKTIANTPVPAPDMSQAANSIADKICERISAKIGSEVSRKVNEAIENKTARIEVHHEHHHTSMYGRFASSEENRKMMVWLSFTTFISLGSLVLFLLRYYELVSWNWGIFPMIYIGVIAISLLGVIVRFFRKN